jgi:hypothetical protein
MLFKDLLLCPAAFNPFTAGSMARTQHHLLSNSLFLNKRRERTGEMVIMT